MLRWMMIGLLAAATVDAALAADMPSQTRPPRHSAAPPVESADSDLLFTPRTWIEEKQEWVQDKLRHVPRPPLLPGSSSLPGYYGSNHSFNYYGAYYSGSNSYPAYWNRLPYTCGTYGYC